MQVMPKTKGQTSQASASKKQRRPSVASKQKGKGPLTQVDPPQSTKKGNEIQQKSRKLLKEKEFPDSELCEFPRVAASHQFHRLMERRQQGNLDWVKYFYHVNTLGVDSEICLPGTDQTVRNFLTADSIREFYGLRTLDHCEYDRLYFNITSDLIQQIRDTLTVPGSNGWFERNRKLYLPRASLNKEAVVWLHFVCANIHPSTHLSDLELHKALLIYLLVTGQPVKVERIIFRKLNEACQSTRQNASIIFPHLIHDRFIQCGAIDDDEDEHFAPREPFTYTCLDRFQPQPLIPRRVAPHMPPAVTDIPNVAPQLDPIQELSARFEAFEARYHEEHKKTIAFLTRCFRQVGIDAEYGVEDDNTDDGSSDDQGD